MLLKHSIKIFMDNKKMMNLSPLTLKKYAYYFKDFQDYCYDKSIVSLEDLTAPFMREYILYRIEVLKNKESTINSHIRTFKSLFNELIREEIMTKNPMDKIKYMIEDIRIETFTQEHLEKMVNYYIRRKKKGYDFHNERGYIAIKVLLGTGIRSGELLNIKWKDVDFVNESITVFGKARRQRTIPLHSQLKRDLSEYRIYLNIIFEQVSTEDYMYPTSHNKQASKSSLDNVFKRLKKAIKLTEVRCSPHTFRHTFAQNWILSGGDVYSLQRILGHSRLESTQKYVNLFSSALRAQNNKFNPLNKISV